VHAANVFLDRIPDVYVTPALQTLRPGEHLLLRCVEVDSQPVLYEWSKVDGSLSSGVHVDMSSGVLEVDSVTERDAGRYRCQATNRAGHSDAFAEIIMAGMSVRYKKHDNFDYTVYREVERYIRD